MKLNIFASSFLTSPILLIRGGEVSVVMAVAGGGRKRRVWAAAARWGDCGGRWWGGGVGGFGREGWVGGVVG